MLAAYCVAGDVCDEVVVVADVGGVLCCRRCV